MFLKLTFVGLFFWCKNDMGKLKICIHYVFTGWFLDCLRLRKPFLKLFSVFLLIQMVYLTNLFWHGRFKDCTFHGKSGDNLQGFGSYFLRQSLTACFYWYSHYICSYLMDIFLIDFVSYIRFQI